MQAGSEGERTTGSLSWFTQLQRYLQSTDQAPENVAKERRSLVEIVQNNPSSADAWCSFLCYEEDVTLSSLSNRSSAQLALFSLFQKATELVPRPKGTASHAYLRIWVGYAKYQWARDEDEGRDTFKALKNQHIGDTSAFLYYEWAKLETVSGNISKALGVIQKGLKEKAEPASLLEKLKLELQSGTLAFSNLTWETEQYSPLRQAEDGVVLQPENNSHRQPGLLNQGDGALATACQPSASSIGHHSSSSKSGPPGSYVSAGSHAEFSLPLSHLGATKSCLSGAVSSASEEDTIHCRSRKTGDSSTTASCSSDELTQRSLEGHANSTTGPLSQAGTLNIAAGMAAVAAINGSNSASSNSGGNNTGNINGGLKKFGFKSKAQRVNGPVLRVSFADQDPQKLAHIALGPVQTDAGPAAGERLPHGSSGVAVQQQPADMQIDEEEEEGEAASTRKRRADIDALQQPPAAHELLLESSKRRSPSPESNPQLPPPVHSQPAVRLPAAVSAAPTKFSAPSTVPSLATLPIQHMPSSELHASPFIPDVQLTENQLSATQQPPPAGPFQNSLPLAAPQLGVADRAHPASTKSVQSSVTGLANISPAIPVDENQAPAPKLHDNIAGTSVQAAETKQGPHVAAAPDSMLSRAVPPPPMFDGRPSATAVAIAEARQVLQPIAAPTTQVPQPQQPDTAAIQAQLAALAAGERPERLAHPQTRALEDQSYVYVHGIRYQKLDCVGRGGSSKVFKVCNRWLSYMQVLGYNRQIYALKRVRLSNKDPEAIKGFIDEISLLRQLRSKPNIIQLIDAQVFREEGLIYIVMEYGDIDLARLLHNHEEARKKGCGAEGEIDENFIRLWWQQMLQAVKGIHDMKIVHSDLKPANFMLVQGQLKLIDFGIAKSIQGDTTSINRESQVGTLNYMSPEAIQGGASNPMGGAPMKVGRPSDIWSLGCILYQMIYGRTPFADLPFIPKMNAICNPAYQISFSACGNPAAVEVMKACLDRNPRTRIAMQELLDHEFLHPERSRPAPQPVAPPAAPQLSEEQLKHIVSQIAQAGASGQADIDLLTKQVLQQLSGQAAAAATSAASMQAAAVPQHQSSTSSVSQPLATTLHSTMPQHPPHNLDQPLHPTALPAAHQSVNAHLPPPSLPSVSTNTAAKCAALPPPPPPPAFTTRAAPPPPPPPMPAPLMSVGKSVATGASVGPADSTPASAAGFGGIAAAAAAAAAKRSARTAEAPLQEPARRPAIQPPAGAAGMLGGAELHAAILQKRNQLKSVSAAAVAAGAGPTGTGGAQSGSSTGSQHGLEAVLRKGLERFHFEDAGETGGADDFLLAALSRKDKD